MTRRCDSGATLQRELLDLVECEQRRIGRELHDGVCQELAGIALLANSMQRKLEKGGTIQADEAAELTGLVCSALRHARGLARGLDPVAAEPHGLAVALQQLTIDTADAASLHCTFYSPHPVEVEDPLTAIHLYRIAQDAVRDAVHDGRATRISIEIMQNPDGLEMCICDDGVDGVAQPCALRMIKHRARMIGAALSVQEGTAAAPGARVACKLPNRTNEDRRLPCP